MRWLIALKCIFSYIVLLLIIRWDPEGTDNPEIIDDWPLHKVSGVSTKVTVGACWQGAEDGYKHGLNGYLAGLSFLPGANENSEVLRCLHQCAESLQVKWCFYCTLLNMF